ncbi:lytic murein transglycosylase B [Acidovorax sp. HMWF029]|uniref:lytic murein transglycosylase B n=1 Tax=Acidovorax sp. HMWF029 TaxID=2056863 RepID=UPI000D36F71A|nr:lytic murein transglycosylase B [Acidovorax sp. HMWF029]
MPKTHRPIALIATLLIAFCTIPASAKPEKSSKNTSTRQPAVLYASRPEALQFADDLAARRDLDREWVRQAIGQAHFLPQVPKLMLPPAKGQAKNWRVYRSRFVEPIRIRAGVRFWQQNQAALERAEREYGVPAETIVGIIGVETIYGQQMGNFRVMDALATLAFDFPSAHPRAKERAEFFRRELEQFLSFTNRSNTDPFEPRGSYAGAMGLGQFMPSSWVRYAIDFDGDGRVDLFKSPADAIGSVANYFRGHGWTPGMPTHFGVQFDNARLQLDDLLAPDILPTFSAASMLAKGAVLDAQGTQHIGPLALVELQNGNDAPSYVAGTENFYAITRYNWSSYYAMAVIELGREVAAARGTAQ